MASARCGTCGIDLRPGSPAFSDRRLLTSGAFLCGECAAALRTAQHRRGLTDLEAAKAIDPDARVRMGAAAALYMGNEHL